MSEPNSSTQYELYYETLKGFRLTLEGLGDARLVTVAKVLVGQMRTMQGTIIELDSKAKGWKGKEDNMKIREEDVEKWNARLQDMSEKQAEEHNRL
jgi:hypothetical protein